MGEKRYRFGRLAHLIVLVLLPAMLAGLVLLAFQGRQVIRETLDGRKAEAADVRQSQFTLREQMNMEQAQARVRGWQSVVNAQEIRLSSSHGRLFAMLYDPIQDREDAPWALVLHGGLGTDHGQVRDVACALSLKGYRVLSPDLYAHGSSEGEIASLGLADAQDIRSWVEWILLEDMNARVVIYGVDEGAAAALLAAGDGLAACVYAVAADSAYVSVQKRAHELLAQADGGRLDKYLLDPAYRFAHGIDIAQGNVAQRISDTEMPLLLIHGTGDGEVLAWQSEDIAAAAGENARLLLVEGAGHGRARFLDPDRYYDVLLGFYDAALSAP